MLPRIDVVIDENNEIHVFATRQISEEEALQIVDEVFEDF